MSTTWIDIITNSAMVFIEDVRMQDDLALSPARFFRKMSLYVKTALPLLNRPPELQTWLTVGMAEPAFAYSEWTATAESTTQETEVITGMTGYGLFSCVTRAYDSQGNVTLTPYTDASYDAETGVVTFPAQPSVGIEYEMDFYTDGTFPNELSDRVRRLLGRAIAVVWDDRFQRNWLNNQMKIHDQSFSTANEGNYMDKATGRMERNWDLLNQELWKYEQDVAYNKIVPSTLRNSAFL